MTPTCPAATSPARDLATAMNQSSVFQDMSLASTERVVQRIELRITAGPEAGRTLTHEFEIAGPALRGGRSELCDLVLRDPRASDVHFELAPQRGALVVRDLDSAGGVLVGDLRVREAWLASGTGFCVGGTHLELVALDVLDVPLLPFCHLGELDGHCPAMRLLFARLTTLAGRPGRGHGLFSGEAGTGKALAAHSLHLLGPERDAAFVAVDLRRLPADQVDLELFGTTTRRGRLAEASGGTLLVHAIDELSLASQAALDRAIATAPVRLLATTRRDLQRLTAAGLFDPDLYARLNGFHIALAPLRDRGRDVVFLAERLLARLAAGGRSRTLSADAITAMREYSWPGNVRELEFVVERARLAAQRGTIERADLGLGRDLDPNLARVAALMRSTHDEAVAGFETLYFRHQLCSHRTKTGAARAAGMTGEGFRLACRRVRVF
ncbi:sigma-54-dependent Fis family transcriptional regulator [Nannocystis radixulma]|uniref:Sigma 54-interacting transcriptional regulator n=1 Tax=Nannocystis radixulma TaxID=2995305 RepID=A0ABT5BAD3_9BACT|nr:sigma 54-interacting transcriptional regulator [Nannocystis radixulma]MDC0671085.1 sigma 54-interacting transcriptional regulator [Nannocystis radixulma]